MGTPSKTYGYARVSTTEQKLDRQITALREFGIEERDIITDKASGKNFERDGYRSLVNALLRPGDTLVVKSLDRFGRNKQAIKEELERLRRMEVRVKILDLPSTLTDFSPDLEWVQELVNNIMIELFSSMAEQERLTMLRRQREGIEAARAKGKHLGRPKAEFPSDWARVYDAWRGGGITAVHAMQLLGLTKSTFYRLVGLWEAEQQKDGSE